MTPPRRRTSSSVRERTATQHAGMIEDGFQSNYIVVDFEGKGAVSKTQELWAMQHLAGMWQDYEGDFPDR